MKAMAKSAVAFDTFLHFDTSFVVLTQNGELRNHLLGASHFTLILARSFPKAHISFQNTYMCSFCISILISLHLIV